VGERDRPAARLCADGFFIEITPGPNMAYLAALSLSSGMRAGFAAVSGIALGLIIYGVIAAFLALAGSLQSTIGATIAAASDAPSR
jgi:threonine/homoserine/homoserine lactone efflux protein